MTGHKRKSRMKIDMSKMVEIPYVPDKDPSKPEVVSGTPEAKAAWSAWHKEKQLAKKLRAEQFNLKTISLEIVGATSFQNTCASCTRSFVSAKASLRHMQRCAKFATRMAYEALYHKTALAVWHKNPALVKTGIGMPDVDPEAVKVERILQASCPCLPEYVYSLMGRGIQSAFAKHAKEILKGNRGVPDPKSLVPLHWRGRAVKLQTDGHFLLVTLPLRTGELCAYATTKRPKKRKAKPATTEIASSAPVLDDVNGSDASDDSDDSDDETTALGSCIECVASHKGKEKRLFPIRGVPGSHRFATVTFKAVAFGSRTHAVLRELAGLDSKKTEAEPSTACLTDDSEEKAKKKAYLRDVGVFFQGKRHSKQKLMLSINYRTPQVPKAQGQPAVVLYSNNNLFYMVAENGKIARMHLEPVRDRLIAFEVRERRSRHIDREVLQDGGPAALALLRTAKDRHFQRGRHARWAATTCGTGHGGHGSTRRYRDTAEVAYSEQNWIDNCAWEAANAIVRKAVQEGVATLHFVKWRDKLSTEIPKEQRHLIANFPRGLITLKAKSVAARDGITVEVVDEPPDACRCPNCHKDLPFPKTGYVRCSCGFSTWRDYWRGVRTLAALGIDVSQLEQDLLRDVKMKRRVVRAGKLVTDVDGTVAVLKPAGRAKRSGGCNGAEPKSQSI